MVKSNEQIAFEKSHVILSTITDCVKNADDMQMYVVHAFYRAYNSEDLVLAYNIANEAFNWKLIAGYKYLELCNRVGYKGEFHQIATENPLIYL